MGWPFCSPDVDLKTAVIAWGSAQFAGLAYMWEKVWFLLFGAAVKLLLLSSALIVATFASPLYAGEVSRAQALDAVAIFEEGKEREAAGDCEAALLLYREADSLYPGALPKYRIAACLDTLGRRSDAIEAYRAFLGHEGAAKHEPLVTRSQARLEALEEKDDAPPPRPKRKKDDKRAKQAPVRDKPARDRAPSVPASDADSGSAATALRVVGFVSLGLAVTSGAALAAVATQAYMAPREDERANYATARTALIPVVAATALTSCVTLPLGYRDDETPRAAAAFVGFGPGGVAFGARY
jgi:hypothetical protein